MFFSSTMLIQHRLGTSVYKLVSYVIATFLLVELFGNSAPASAASVAMCTAKNPDLATSVNVNANQTSKSLLYSMTETVLTKRVQNLKVRQAMQVEKKKAEIRRQQEIEDASEKLKLHELEEASKVAAEKKGTKTVNANLPITYTNQSPLDMTKVTYAEVDLLAHLIYAEAGDEPYVGKIAVGNVVINRAKKYGKSITDIIYQPSQFSSLQSKNFISVPNADSIKAADDVLGGAVVVPGAFYFVNLNLADPIWSTDSGFIERIGDHWFYNISVAGAVGEPIHTGANQPDEEYRKPVAEITLSPDASNASLSPDVTVSHSGAVSR